MRLSQKIAIGAILLAAIPVVVASLIIQPVATSSSHQALEQAAMERLVALRDAKKTQIEDYCRYIHNQVLNLSKSTTAIEAQDNFRDAVSSYRKELFQPDVEKFRSEFTEYYRAPLTIRRWHVEQHNRGTRADVKPLMSGLDEDATALQYHYIKQHTSAGRKRCVA